MAKDNITDWDTAPDNNEDVGGIDIRGTAKVSNFDNGLREVMAQIADVNAGNAPVADTWSFADPADLTKIVRLDAGNVTAGASRVLTMADSNLDLANVPRADTAQSFDADEKAQLLENIGAAWELIGTYVLSGDASIPVTDLSAARRVRVSGFVRPTTDGASLYIRTSTDNGANYDSGASDYAVQTSYHTGSTSAGSAANTTSFFLNFTAIGNATSPQEGVAFEFTIHQFNQATFAWAVGQTMQRNASNVLYAGTIAGQRMSATARNALQIIASTGTLAEGQVTVEIMR